jgi:hypothetical protein
MDMNLQENVDRIREIMEVKPLNENTSKFRLKFGDFINKIFKKKKGNSSNDIRIIVNPENKYDQKYGISAKNGGIVESFTTYERGDEYNSLLDIIIFTEETMKYITYYLNYSVNDTLPTQYNYEFFKSLYYKDKVLTDEYSSITQDGNNLCKTDTLGGQKGGCTLSSEVKQNILKRYEKDRDYQKLKGYLDRISG